MAIDWTAPMQQTFEFYILDPNTFINKTKVDTVLSGNIDRDADSETLGSASFEITETLDECYLRTYLICIQNGVEYRECLGTHLVQAPSDSFDGKRHTISLDGYTPLIELKENQPQLGYALPIDSGIKEYAYLLTRNHCRAPVVKSTGTDTNLTYSFVSENEDTWLSFVTDLLAIIDQKYDLEADGTIVFAPNQNADSMMPRWTYTDDNSSILYPDVSIERDIYSIPNVVEVILSTDSGYIYGRAVNDALTSPTSTRNRGREITHREVDPDLNLDNANITTDSARSTAQAIVDAYAEKLLKDMSTLECKVTYSHGYNGVRVNDCVLLNYERAGITDVKAKVISQSIELKPGCKVQESAIFSKKLWR